MLRNGMTLLMAIAVLPLNVPARPALASIGYSRQDASDRPPIRDPITPEGALRKPETLVHLEQAFADAPDDGHLQQLVAEATLALADTVFHHSAAPPNRKYPIALRLYREVTRLDAGNAKAQEAVRQIESIYTSTGRPIPTNDDLLLATPPASSEEAARRDVAIREAIERNLISAGIDGVVVTVSGAVATLRGTIPRHEMKAAVKAAYEADPTPARINNELRAQ